MRRRVGCEPRGQFGHRRRRGSVHPPAGPWHLLINDVATSTILTLCHGTFWLHWQSFTTQLHLYIVTTICLLFFFSIYASSRGADWHISESIWWITMEFCTNILGPQRLNPSELGEPPDFSSSTAMWLTFVSTCLQHYNLAGSKNSVQRVAVSHTLASVFPLQFTAYSHTHLYSVLCTPTHTVHAHWAEVMSWDGSCFVIQWGETGRVSIPHRCTSSRPYRRTTIRGHVELAAVIKCDVV